MISLEELTHKEIVELDKDYEEVAKTARLRYVSDSSPGIKRIKKGIGFRYALNGKALTEKKIIERIKKLAIPPSWTKVWICPFPHGHLQATGYDLRNRKQYRYHTDWRLIRHETKFHRLYEFGKSLPALRARVEKDLRKNNLSQQHVMATVISLLERTYIRIGNEDYEKLYGSHGITTLKNNHVKINGSEIRFSFKGKKGIVQSVTVRNKRLARLVRQCRDIPGKELFQYYDEKGTACSIDSGMVNDYIKQATGSEFTAKDFRTWAGSLNFLRSLHALGEDEEKDFKKNIVQALDEVSKKLGNTRAICKKYYVHPGLIQLYEQNNLNRYFKELDDLESNGGKTELATDEKILLRILKWLQ